LAGFRSRPSRTTSFKRPTWRGQQYSLALFPLWIKAVTSAVGNVFFGRKLGFVVTSKVRQGGASWSLVRYQLIVMAALLISLVIGLLKLALGLTSDEVPIVVNALWAIYDLIALSVILRAVTYQPPEEEVIPATVLTIADAHGRAGAGRG
jgi:cellulose synthase (UDP-forming)